jgi:hypothetical protein
MRRYHTQPATFDPMALAEALRAVAQAFQDEADSDLRRQLNALGVAAWARRCADRVQRDRLAAQISAEWPK